jgi:hypothetical protein
MVPVAVTLGGLERTEPVRMIRVTGARVSAIRCARAGAAIPGAGIRSIVPGRPAGGPPRAGRIAAPSGTS